MLCSSILDENAKIVLSIENLNNKDVFKPRHDTNNIPASLSGHCAHLFSSPLPPPPPFAPIHFQDYVVLLFMFIFKICSLKKKVFSETV